MGSSLASGQQALAATGEAANEMASLPGPGGARNEAPRSRRQVTRPLWSFQLLRESEAHI